MHGYRVPIPLDSKYIANINFLPLLQTDKTQTCRISQISQITAYIITEEPEGTFYTNTSGTYPLDRLVRVGGVRFNIPIDATLGDAWC